MAELDQHKKIPPQLKNKKLQRSLIFCTQKYPSNISFFLLASFLTSVIVYIITDVRLCVKLFLFNLFDYYPETHYNIFITCVRIKKGGI